MTRPRLWTAAAAATLAAVLLTGCTTSQAVDPTAAPSTPVPSPTPTPTFSPDQASAVAVAQKYEGLLNAGLRDPQHTGQVELAMKLKPYAEAPMIQAAVDGVYSWYHQGWKLVGDQVTVTTTPSEPSLINKSTKVVVSICTDQTKVSVVDKAGNPVTDPAARRYPYILRSIDVRRAPGKPWLVWGTSGQEVRGC